MEDQTILDKNELRKHKAREYYQKNKARILLQQRIYHKNSEISQECRRRARSNYYYLHVKGHTTDAHRKAQLKYSEKQKLLKQLDSI